MPNCAVPRTRRAAIDAAGRVCERVMSQVKRKGCASGLDLVGDVVSPDMVHANIGRKPTLEEADIVFLVAHASPGREWSEIKIAKAARAAPQNGVIDREMCKRHVEARPIIDTGCV